MTRSQTQATAPRAVAGPAFGAWEARVGGVRVLFGERRLADLGQEARGLGARRVLLVTDGGLRSHGHAAAAAAALEGADLAVWTYDEVGENPTAAQVAAGAAFAAGKGIDLVVGLGGGSALDSAKGVNFLLTNGGSMEDYWGYDRAPRPLLPGIGVPTTAGTGSEAQSYALISQDGTGRKMACGAPGALFAVALLDPDLLATAPRRVVASAGLDAVAHAVESYVCTRSNPVSRLLAGEAWRLLDASLEEALAGPPPAEARRRLHLGAHLAGAAIEQSMLGAAHACANPLTAAYDVAHGEAVSLLLPHVVRFNAAAASPAYAELLAFAGWEPTPDPAAALAARLEELLRAAGVPWRLRDCGVPLAELAALAREAASQWTARFNPRAVDETDFLRLYEAAH